MTFPKTSPFDNTEGPETKVTIVQDPTPQHMSRIANLQITDGLMNILHEVEGAIYGNDEHDPLVEQCLYRARDQINDLLKKIRIFNP